MNELIVRYVNKWQLKIKKEKEGQRMTSVMLVEDGSTVK